MINIDWRLIAIPFGVAMLLFSSLWLGKIKGEEWERGRWEKGVEITKTAYAEAAKEAFELREQLQRKTTQRTNRVIKQSKVYYETNPNPVCLIESRSLFVGEGRRRIARSAGGEVVGEGNASASRPEESADSE